MTNKELLPKMGKVLIPIEESVCSERALVFAGCLLARLSPEITQEVWVVHVLSATYLQTMAQRLDFRVEVLKDTALFRSLRENYLKEKVYPLLDKALEQLRALGVKAELKKEVLHGDPAKEIINLAQEGGFQTVIMGRRGLSCLKEKFLGSCSLAVSHRSGSHTTYIVGQKIKDHTCPPLKIVVPVDGSKPSLGALKEASGLALALEDKVKAVSLLHVIDAAYELDHLPERIEEAKKLLEEFKNKALSYGVPEGMLRTDMRIGRPASEIISYASEEGFNLIIMGRRGLTGLKEFILGSVSSKVLHKAEDFTVALVSE